MNNVSLQIPLFRFRQPSGMTLLEMLLAMSMLVVFTGVVAMVMQVTLRFLADAGADDSTAEIRPNGVVIDHAEIHGVMDRLVDVLAQPGVTQALLEGDIPGKSRIAFDQGTSPGEACIEGVPDAASGRNRFDLGSRWHLPFPLAVKLPPSYRLCLWRTSLAERSTTSTPGVYVLQVLPDRVSASTLPTRRLFCRPRPNCESLAAQSLPSS